MWHNQYSKISLSIWDKSQHQKRHLKSISDMKSRIDSKEPWKKSITSHDTFRHSLSPFQRDKISHQNYLLAHKIINIGKKPIKKQNITNRYCEMSRSLSSIVVENRNRTLKKVDKENVDMYKRLVFTKPMYKTDNFKRFMKQTNKYRNNILRSRIHNIDYNKLANLKLSNSKFRIMDDSNFHQNL